MSDQNVDVVKSSYAAFGRGDIDGLLAALDPAIEWVTPGPPDLATAGTRLGHDAVREFFKTLDDMYEIQSFEPKTFISQGEHVIVLGEDTVKIKATGTVLTESWVHHMTVRNGRVVAFREYMDMVPVVAELRMTKAEV
jgi:ketosteroid isomerase-like protein